METTESIYCLSPNIALRKVDDLNKYWAFNLTDGSQYELNATSYWLLENFDGKNSLDVIIGEFSNVFEVEELQYEADIMEIVGEFINQAIIIEKRCNHEEN